MNKPGGEREGLIVGDSSFDLVEKHAKFARWDARKALRASSPGEYWQSKAAEIFEGSTNEDLLTKMSKMHSFIMAGETSGRTRDQILRDILTQEPNMNYYSLLFKKVPWGHRLRIALYREHYAQENSFLWDDLVMNRIHRTLGGRLSKTFGVSGKLFYQIERDKDILDFHPVNNTQELMPVVDIHGEKKDRIIRSAWQTDQRFDLCLANVSRIEVCEREESVEFIKSFPGEEIGLVYRQKPIGSTHKIELRSYSSKGEQVF